MTGGRRSIGLLLAALLGGCAGGPKLPTVPFLPPAGPPATTATTTATPAEPAGATGPIETAVMVPGTPTAVFTEVARGAFACWLGADGPLKASHVYRAEAEPPAKGGAAEIVLHERDISLRDQRGPRALHISFTSEGGGVRVVTQSLRFDQAHAQAMTRDVETWAKGGSGCQLRVLFPPPPPPPAKTAKARATPAKTAKSAAATKKR